MRDYNTQPFDLPSLAEAYAEDGIPAKITIRPFESGDHRSMAGASDGVDIYKHLLSRLVVEPKSINIERLLMGDINAILVMSRILTQGPEYTAKYTCTECDERQKAKMMLNELVIRKADDEEFTQFDGFRAEDIEIKVGDHQFKLHLSRLEDEIAIQQIIRAKKRKDEIGDEQIDRSYIRLARLIDSIDEREERNISEKLKFIDRLHPDDHEDILEALNKRDIGFLPHQYFPCRTCGEDNRVRMELDAEFFRAVSRRKR